MPPQLFRRTDFVLATIGIVPYLIDMVVFLDGRFLPEEEAVVSVNDRGFLYGDGLFETVRIFNGRPFRFAQHIERMVRGADFLKISLPLKPKELQQVTSQLIEKNNLPDSILRVTLTRGPGERGYTPKPGGKPTMLLALHPAPPFDAVAPPQCSLITSSHKIPASDALSSFKTTSKLLQVAARIEAESKNADEALILNTNGEVAEAAAGNFFWIYKGKVCTIPTGRGVLPGITRAVVLEICQALGFETNKRVIKPDALRHSDAIFLSQSGQGIVSVINYDGEMIAQSPLVEKIHQVYCEMLAKE
jgi:branched-chain amino acid aminotransferase